MTSLPANTSTTTVPSDETFNRSFLERVKSILVGDDMFISYARGDSSDYATALAVRLSKKGFLCYLDQYGTDINDFIPRRLKLKLWRSTVLVLVGSRSAVLSKPIRDEVELFKETERAIIPIDIDGAFMNTELYQVVRGLPIVIEPQPNVLQEEMSVVSEINAQINEVTQKRIITETVKNLEQAAPSPSVIDGVVNSFRELGKSKPSARTLERIANAFTYTRRTQWQRRMLIGAFSLILLSLGIAGFFLNASRNSAVAAFLAETKQQQADRAAQEAEDRKKFADLQALNAQVKASKAEDNEKVALRNEQEATANANTQKRIASAIDRTAIAAKLIKDEPDKALDISVGAYASSPKLTQTRGGLLNALQEHLHLKSIYRSNLETVTSLSSTLSGRLLLSLSGPDKEVILWNVTKGVRVGSIEAPGGSWVDMTCDESGNLCSFRDEWGGVYLWRFEYVGDKLSKKQEVNQIPQAEVGVSSGSFPPSASGPFMLLNDDRLIAVNGSGEVVSVNLKSSPASVAKYPSGFTSTATCIATDKNKETLAIGFEKGVALLKLSDLSSPPVVLQFPAELLMPDLSTSSLSFRNDGQVLAVGREDDTVLLVDIKKPVPEIKFTLRDAGATVAFASQAENGILITAKRGGAITGWNTQDVMVQTKTEPSTSTAPAQSSDQEQQDNVFIGDSKAVGNDDDKEKKPKAPQVLWRELYRPGLYSLSRFHSMSADIFATGSSDGSIALWDVNQSTSLAKTFAKEDGPFEFAAFNKSGEILLTIDVKGEKNFWRLKGDNLVRLDDSQIPAGPNAGASFPKLVQTFLNPVTDTPTILIKDAVNPDSNVMSIFGADVRAENVAVSPDNRLAAIVRGYDVQLCKLNKDDDKTTCYDHLKLPEVDPPESVAFSHNSRHLAVGYFSGQIVLWDLQRLKVIRHFVSPTTVNSAAIFQAQVVSLAFTPDGSVLASSSPYSPLNLWDVETGALLGPLKWERDADMPFQKLRKDLGLHSSSLTFSREGRKLVSVGGDGITVWDVNPNEWKRRALSIANRRLR